MKKSLIESLTKDCGLHYPQQHSLPFWAFSDKDLELLIQRVILKCCDTIDTNTSPQTKIIFSDEDFWKNVCVNDIKKLL